jgi:predicted AAA+ superfamily ATPase
MQINRTSLFDLMSVQLAESRALALLGARQVGKTTLARAYAATHHCAYFDLEDPAALEALAQPQDALQSLLAQGRTVVIDEVQRRVDLFPLLRTLIDWLVSTILAARRQLSWPVEGGE